MKIKDLHEAQLASTNRNDVIAKWLIKSLQFHGSPYKLFINIATHSGVEGGLDNAVKAIQEWNVVAKFIHDNTDQTRLMTMMVVSPRELNKWIEEYQDY